MERSRVQLEAYDELALQYSRAIDVLPDQERTSLPPALQLQKQH